MMAPAAPMAPRRIRVGVCARDKKAHSKPMKEILSRFNPHLFDVVLFGDEAILHAPVERWPICDCLMSWYSNGFPLDKAEAYVKLRQPFCVNDLATEYAVRGGEQRGGGDACFQPAHPRAVQLRDRRQFYSILQRHGIPTPAHVVLDRSRAGPPPVVVETEDAVEVDGVRINKPFVEKVSDPSPLRQHTHSLTRVRPHACSHPAPARACSRWTRRITTSTYTTPAGWAAGPSASSARWATCRPGSTRRSRTSAVKGRSSTKSFS